MKEMNHEIITKLSLKQNNIFCCKERYVILTEMNKGNSVARCKDCGEKYYFLKSNQ